MDSVQSDFCQVNAKLIWELCLIYTTFLCIVLLWLLRALLVLCMLLQMSHWNFNSNTWTITFSSEGVGWERSRPWAAWRSFFSLSFSKRASLYLAMISRVVETTSSLDRDWSSVLHWVKFWSCRAPKKLKQEKYVNIWFIQFCLPKVAH